MQMIDFSTIDYLQHGSRKQQEIYHVLKKYRIIEELEGFDPIVVGTIPLNIDINESDVDITCNVMEHLGIFKDLIMEKFSQYPKFRIKVKEWYGLPTVVANFWCDAYEIEIFAQNVPTMEQNGYRHLMIEYDCIEYFGNTFREAVINLKKNGLKTQHAFAKLLDLKGNPYDALLKYEIPRNTNLSLI